MKLERTDLGGGFVVIGEPASNDPDRTDVLRAELATIEANLVALEAKREEALAELRRLEDEA